MGRAILRARSRSTTPVTMASCRSTETIPTPISTRVAQSGEWLSLRVNGRVTGDRVQWTGFADVVRLDLNVSTTSLPEDFALLLNYPNPFNPETTIRYNLKEVGPVSLVVYDITGQLVKTLTQGEQPAGQYQITWDGRNTAGTQVASGVYLYELRAGGFRAVPKMVLMK